MKKKGALFYLLSLSIIIDIDIDRANFDTPQTRMVERFLKLNTTEKWGLHNRKVGFAQPKSGVCTTEKWGLHNRKVGYIF